MKVFLIFIFFYFEKIKALDNCPMPTVRAIIKRAVDSSGPEAALQMQVIRKIMEDIYGGTWGVLIIKQPGLISTSVHWTIPDHKHRDGTPAFCLHVQNGWQYNVFKTGNVDTENRLTVESIVKRLREGKQRPEKMTLGEFDRRIAEAFRRRRKLRSYGNFDYVID